MDETQIDKLGSKMRDVYADVASEAPVPANVPKHPSRRLRKNHTFARASERKAAPAPGSIASGFVTQYPVALVGFRGGDPGGAAGAYLV